MAALHYRLNEDCVASDVMRWYDKVPLGDTVVIALPSPYPSVWLFRCANARVYWWTEGGRGLPSLCTMPYSGLPCCRPDGGCIFNWSGWMHAWRVRDDISGGDGMHPCRGDIAAMPRAEHVFASFSFRHGWYAIAP
jgi:hypothetical protein